MNKQEFLNELQSRIRILEEAEQQDILAEYAQHIDLRTAGGLSEEEAIRDFGNPEELAAEILEAYHVDPARVEAPPSQPLAGVSSGLKRTAGRCRRFLGRIGGGLRSLASRIAAWWGSLGQRLRGLRRSPGSPARRRRRKGPLPRLPVPPHPHRGRPGSPGTGPPHPHRGFPGCPGTGPPHKGPGAPCLEPAAPPHRPALRSDSGTGDFEHWRSGSTFDPGVSPGGTAAVLSGTGTVLYRSGGAGNHAGLEAPECRPLVRSSPGPLCSYAIPVSCPRGNAQ